MLFNCGCSALALCGGAHLRLVAAPAAGDGVEPSRVELDWGLGVAGPRVFALNSGLTAVAVSLSKGLPIVSLWRQHFAIISLNYFAAGSAAFLLVMLLQSIGAPAFAAVLPLIFVCYVAMQSWLGRVDDAQRHVKKLNDLYMSTIAFSTAIEAKDGVTGDHVHRVQAYALGLARALGVHDQETLQAIEAALLHDTGKLAVPEHILNKPHRRRRKLSADEGARGCRRRHPVVDRFLPGRADRARTSRKLGRPAICAKLARRGHSDRRAHSLPSWTVSMRSHPIDRIGRQ